MTTLPAFTTIAEHQWCEVEALLIAHRDDITALVGDEPLEAADVAANSMAIYGVLVTTYALARRENRADVLDHLAWLADGVRRIVTAPQPADVVH